MRSGTVGSSPPGRLSEEDEATAVQHEGFRTTTALLNHAAKDSTEEAVPVALQAREARHEALLRVASSDVDGGATQALTAALHERAFRPSAGSPAHFAPRQRLQGAGWAVSVSAEAAASSPAGVGTAGNNVLGGAAFGSASFGSAERDALRAARNREAPAAWEDAASFVADACEAHRTQQASRLPGATPRSSAVVTLSARLASAALSADVDDFLARCLSVEAQESGWRCRNGKDALALAAGALHHAAFPDALDAALGALALYAAEEAPFDATNAARAARTALLLVARFVLLARFSDSTSAARALGSLAALAQVPAEAPPDGVPRAAHSAAALVLVADVMAEHPHAVALHTAGVGAIAALMGARRALNGAPDYAQCADAEMRSWVSRGALARALHAATAAADAAAPEPYGSYACEHACHVAAHAMRWAVREMATGRLSCEHPDAVALASAALAVADALAAAGCVASAVDAVLGRPLHDFFLTTSSGCSQAQPPLSSPANTEVDSALSACDNASELSPVRDMLYVAADEGRSPRGDEAAEAMQALPLCITVVPTAEDMAARCASNKASAHLDAIAATAFLVNALQENPQFARGAAAAATSALKRAVDENAGAQGETVPARRSRFSCCFAPPVGFNDARLLNKIVCAAPFGASADVLLAHCLSTHTLPPGLHLSRNVLLLAAGALAYISVPETCAAAFARATSALVAGVMEHPERYQAKGEAGSNACVGLVQVLRVVLSKFTDDAMMSGSALEALAMLTTCVHVDQLWNSHFQVGLSMRLGALAADAMLQHAPFMAVQAAGTTMLAHLLLSNDIARAFASDGQLSTTAVLSKGHAEWVRDDTLSRASTALLFALRGAAMAAAKVKRQGRPVPPHAERILRCAPAALASALRIVCADDAVYSGSSRLEETQRVLLAVLDVCSSLEAVSSAEVVAAADAHLLPALTEMLSSRMWWEQSRTAGYNSPESTAQLLTAVANARERADRRNAIAAAYSAPLTAAPPKSAPPHKAQPFGDDLATRDLIDSLLAAQADMAARLHAMEDGMARASEGAERRM